jgi:hypothetical protein
MFSVKIRVIGYLLKTMFSVLSKIRVIGCRLKRMFRVKNLCHKMFLKRMFSVLSKNSCRRIPSEEAVQRHQ